MSISGWPIWGTILGPGEAGPVVVTGWVGVIIENATGGYLNRCAADVIAVNCQSDLRHFAGVADRLGLPTQNLLLTGLPILSSVRQPLREGPIRRILFADQPTVPRSPDERLFVYRRLIDYAEIHPERHVVLKPRHRLGEDTFHRMRHHPEALLAGQELPVNFTIDYAPVAAQLPTTDLLLTVSSTACLEAIDHGCRVGLVLDLGVHEKLGNHVFLTSGLLRTFDQITADDVGVPDPDWLADYFIPRSDSAAAMIADRAAGLAGQRRTAVAVRTESALLHQPRRLLRRRRENRRPSVAGPLAKRLARSVGVAEPRCVAAGPVQTGARAGPSHGSPALSCSQPEAQVRGRVQSMMIRSPGSG